MRHYYDSIRFPFLSDILFDQLLNFDWETSRKEIEEERKKRECGNKCGKRRCDYLQVNDDNLNNDIQFFGPKFELGEDGVYTYKTSIPKDIKPGELKIDAYTGGFYVGYEHKTETGSYSSASVESLPEDLDIDTMKAVLKNGTLTITAKQVEKKEEPEVEEEDETEYEIEIGK